MSTICVTTGSSGTSVPRQAEPMTQASSPAAGITMEKPHQITRKGLPRKKVRCEATTPCTTRSSSAVIPSGVPASRSCSTPMPKVAT